MLRFVRYSHPDVPSCPSESGPVRSLSQEARDDAWTRPTHVPGVTATSPRGAGGSPTHGSPSFGVFEELRMLQQEHAAVEHQRDQLDSRCSYLEGEVQRCQVLIQKLQESAHGPDIPQRMDQVCSVGPSQACVRAAAVGQCQQGQHLTPSSLPRCRRPSCKAPRKFPTCLEVAWQLCTRCATTCEQR